MADFVGLLDAAVESVARLRNTLHKGKNPQVRRSDELAHVRATAQTWFKNQRPLLAMLKDDPTLKAVDQGFATLLEWADQSTALEPNASRSHFKRIKTQLVRLRSSGVLVPPSVDPPRPRFASLISDAKMLDILERRRRETLACQEVHADLAATVMLGGLLEALFLARINRLRSLAPVFTATAAPKRPRRT